MSWPIVTLSDVAEVRLGRQRSPKNHTGEQMRSYLRAANVTWDGLSLGDVKTMNFTDSEMDTYQLAPGDILLSEASGSPGEVGKPALWSEEIEECAFQNTLIRIRPREHSPKFLLHYFRWQALAGRFAKHSRGVGIHHIGRTRLAGWPTPLPPLDEQLRIVDILEDHLSRLDAASSMLDTATRRTTTWRKAATQAAVWTFEAPVVAVADLLREPMRNGRSDSAAAGESDGVRTLTLTAVTRNEFTDTNTKITTTSRDRARSLWLEPGDILVQRSNTPELVGTTARYDGPRDWAIFPDLLIRLRADESVIDSRYLVAALRTERVHRSLRSKAKGLAGSMPKIDQGTIGSARVPVPTLERQQEIVEIIGNIEIGADRALRGLKAQNDRAAALRLSLLAAAFSGQLTGHSSDLSRAGEMIGV